jgi:NADH-quinone oxidoreductase subunit L
MVARMSPLFELSDTALNVVLVVGGITAFFMALVGLVQTDIKRVVAYSTLSQLGYMTVALGASAYAAGIFHLGTHAFFKALLFLAAGSVIIAMHHEQDMRRMGGLRRVMPITWITMIIGTLALIGTPGFSGFFSKDAIIEAVHFSEQPAAGFAYYALTAGTFVTAFYSWRLIFLTFYGKPRDQDKFDHAVESPRVVTWPLILLAIPSVVIGWIFVQPMLFGDFFGDSIVVLPSHDTLARIAEHQDPDHSAAWQMVSHGILALPVVLTVLGSVLAWIMYMRKPDLPGKVAHRLSGVYRLLMNKYGFDEFNEFVFARGARRIGNIFWRIGDVKLIDGLMVNGTARVVGWISSVVRLIQTGYVYHYAFAMIIGLFVIMTWFLAS